MDYVVGSIADLISGNVTPNRPKVAKRAVTPTKHMPSPNVTPKSEFVTDRSIFLSPTMQKKKAIVKKSPKRIFQNPDLDVTNENESNLNSTSPKADKVKKHLKIELESNTSLNTSTEAAKSPKKKRKSAELSSPSKNVTEDDLNSSKENLSANDLTPKKKKKKRNSASEVHEEVIKPMETLSNEGTPKKKKKQKNNSISEVQSETKAEATVNGETNASMKSPKKKKKNKNKAQTEIATTEMVDQKVAERQEAIETSKKKNRKRKNSKNKIPAEENFPTAEAVDEEESKPKKIKKIKVNPNAVTDKDSDSEHESDNEIKSENEETNKEVLENDLPDDSSDEEETPKPKKEKMEKPATEKVKEINTEEEIKRTLFVGNVPFSKKCKKEIKKIFNHYGLIESVRIRTVPVKNPSVSPKVAVIKEELHPERSTVNVYVKFADPESVEAALVENNTVLNDHNLRVTRSGSTGSEYDPRRSVFVGNVPFALEDQALREKFQGCGEIESVRIVRDRKTNAGKGFGYVNFVSKDGVELALALTEEDLTIKNRIMRVKRCTQATQRQSQKNTHEKKKNFQPRQGFQGKRVSQGDRQRNTQGQGGFKKGNFQNRGYFGKEDGQKDGAYRRVINKRKSQESGDGPPPKTSRDGAPREKKPRKEFVGITAEKKKKHKFDKGQKKKKALSEILTKYS